MSSDLQKQIGCKSYMYDALRNAYDVITDHYYRTHAHNNPNNHYTTCHPISKWEAFKRAAKETGNRCIGFVVIIILALAAILPPTLILGIGAPGTFQNYLLISAITFCSLSVAGMGLLTSASVLRLKKAWDICDDEKHL